MENLTKHQIILVTLLVSFVTSIATGIITVSLMDQAPAGVTQTINRVVERTIERVVPAENQSASVVRRETVVVRSDDLVVSALEKNSKSLVRIFKIVGSGELRDERFVSLGVVVSKDGLIATDSGVLSQVADESGAPIAQSFYAKVSDGKFIDLESKGADLSGVALFAPKVSAPVKDKIPELIVYVPATFGDSAGIKLGQAIVALQGRDNDSTETGIISSLTPMNTDKVATTTPDTISAPALFITDISESHITLGSILLNLTGEIIGMKVGRAVPTDSAYLPGNIVKTAIDTISALSKEKKS